jgi:hypothetical protein
VVSFERFLLQGEAQRFSVNFSCSRPVRALRSFPAPTHSLIGNSERHWQCKAHTALAAAFVLYHARIGKGAMDIQYLESVANCAMKFFLYQNGEAQ